MIAHCNGVLFIQRADRIVDIDVFNPFIGFRAIHSKLHDCQKEAPDKKVFFTTRYFDIVRNRTFREKLRGKFKTLSDQDVKDGALFFPISFDAFQNNTKMTQNIYWKRNGFAI